MRLIDADKLKAHYAWWETDPDAKHMKALFDVIVDQQPTVTEAEVAPTSRRTTCKGGDAS